MSTSTLTLAEPSAMITKEFLLGGRAVFTVEPSAEFCDTYDLPPHYTFRITRKDSTAPIFAWLLAGPCNESDYVYLGMVNEAYGRLILTRKSKMTADSWVIKILGRVLARIFAGEGDKITEAGWSVHHEGKCSVCGRSLTTPESCERGIGPECIKRIRGE